MHDFIRTGSRIHRIDCKHLSKARDGGHGLSYQMAQRALTAGAVQLCRACKPGVKRAKSA